MERCLNYLTLNHILIILANLSIGYINPLVSFEENTVLGKAFAVFILLLFVLIECALLWRLAKYFKISRLLEKASLGLVGFVVSCLTLAFYFVPMFN